MKIRDSKSREAKNILPQTSENCKVTELLKVVKETCDSCSERVFCEFAYDIRGCNGRSQSDR